jgi:hypothetical protein
MIGNPDCVGDDSKRRIYGACRDEAGGVDDIEVVEVMGFAMQVEDAASRIVAHAAGTVLVADALQGYALFEVGMKRDRPARVPCLFEEADPTVLKALE